MTNKFTQEQLENAFTLIANPSDWKAPICASVTGEQVALAVEAVIHFTATVPSVSIRLDADSPIQYVIRSIGYRAGPAGDH